MRVIVADTAPLNYLVLIEAVGILPRLFAFVLIPPAVKKELSHLNAPAAVSTWIANPPSWLISKEPGSIEAHLGGIRQFVTKRLADLQGLLSGETSLARAELKKHVGEIRMIPQSREGRPHYVAEGAWDLLGKEKGPAHNTAPLPIRMVAGACNVPNLLTLVFRIELISAA